MASKQDGEELISLEDLIGGETAPAAAGAESTSSAAAPDSTPAPQAEEEGKIIAQTDGEGSAAAKPDQPEASAKEQLPSTPQPQAHVRRTGIKGLVHAVRFRLTAGVNRILGLFRSLAFRSGSSLRTVAAKAWGVLFNHLTKMKSGTAGPLYWLKRFSALPRKSKLAVTGIGILIWALILVARLAFKDALLPEIEVRFIPSVAAYADASWSYPEHEETDDFFSPMRHPEYVVLLERIVVNLRPSENSGPNPMGMFEFYLETNTQEAAIEINDREADIRDRINRSMENVAFDEAITSAGKNKIKLILRKHLNGLLTKGRVRRVYFKAIVVKP